MTADDDDEDLSPRINTKVDAILANLSSLADGVDRLTNLLARADAQAVRAAFRAKEQEAPSGN